MYRNAQCMWFSLQGIWVLLLICYICWKYGVAGRFAHLLLKLSLAYVWYSRPFRITRPPCVLGAWECLAFRTFQWVRIHGSLWVIHFLVNTQASGIHLYPVCFLNFDILLMNHLLDNIFIIQTPEWRFKFTRVELSITVGVWIKQRRNNLQT